MCQEFARRKRERSERVKRQSEGEGGGTLLHSVGKRSAKKPRRAADEEEEEQPAPKRERKRTWQPGSESESEEERDESAASDAGMDED